MKTLSLIKRRTHKNVEYSNKNATSRSLHVELLEDRALLSISTAGFSVFESIIDESPLTLDNCVAPSLQRASLVTIDTPDRYGCSEETAELRVHDIRSFEALLDEILPTVEEGGAEYDELYNYVFNLNSCPNSAYTIYLDFNGNEYTGFDWHNNVTDDAKITTPPYDSDGSPYLSDNTTPSFTSSELREIYEMWYRVSEDFIPFDINVTTQKPVKEQEGQPIEDQFVDNTRAIRVAIGGSCYDWFITKGDSAEEEEEDSAVGGVAINSSFISNSDAPCYVFPKSIAVGNVIYPKYVADTISHEVGHTLGLNHDGRIAHVDVVAETYYQGADNWAPLMGTAWYGDLTQWSKGEYEHANNDQDDLNIITTNNGFSYRDDDHGDSIATASPLDLTASGTLASGIIERNTDVDFFSFILDEERTFIRIGGTPSVTNLDVIVNLYAESGELLKTYDPLDTFFVSIDTRDPVFASGASGKYYLGVAGTGRTVDGCVHYTDYASLGSYSITEETLFDPYELNESNAAAFDLGLIKGEKTLTAHVGSSVDRDDYYQFTIDSTTTGTDYAKVDYEYNKTSGNVSQWVALRLYKYDSNENKWKSINKSHVEHASNSDQDIITIQAEENISLKDTKTNTYLEPGKYLLRIDNERTDPNDYIDNEVPFPYTLTISVGDNPTPIDSITLSNDAPARGDEIRADVFLENNNVAVNDDNPDNPDNPNVAFQWYRGTRSDFVTTPILGKKERSYTTSNADVGYFLTVKAFGVNGYEGTVSATTSAPVGLVEPVWDIVVTLDNDEGSDHDNNFNAEIGAPNGAVATDDFDTMTGGAAFISLREAYDYVNCYFVGDSANKLNYPRYWRRVENENDLSYNASTGQYYYVDDGKCYVVFKTIEFANNVRNISLTGDIETNKSFTIKGSYVNENDIGVSISPALVLDVNNVPVSPAQYVQSRIFNVQQGSIVAENLVLKNGYDDKGGALKIAAGASYLARGGSFENNKATRGGAVYNEGIFTTTNGTSFTNNVATPVAGENGSFGGAIFNKNGKVLIGDNVTQTQFSGNKATDLGTTPAGLQATSNYIKGYNGGAIYNSSGTVAVYKVVFSNNFAGKYGGAVSNFGTFNAINTTFENNVASSGGAVQNSGTIEFKGTTNFNQNKALKSRYLLVANSSDYGGNGGAIFTSGAGNSVTFLAKTTFDGNQAANAGGAIDFISGSLAFTGTGSKIYEFQKNVAGTIGGAIIVGGASVDTGDGVTAFEFHGGGNDDNRNAVKSFTPCSVVNEKFHKTVETELDENNLPVNQTKARYAPNVAITCDVGDNSAIGNIAKGFFGDNVFQNSKLQDRHLVDVFERYATVTNGSVSFEDLAKSFSSTPNTIYYRVDDGSSFKSLTNVNNNNVVTLTGIGSHKITYYADQNTNVMFVANFYVVDPNTSLKVDVNLFDLADRAYVCSDVQAVGVSVQVYSTSNNPVHTWEFCWDSENNPNKWETYNNFGFTCNAYHPYAAGTYELKVKIDDSEPDGSFTITVPIPTPAEGEGSAILDAESDFFADLDLVDELFDD